MIYFNETEGLYVPFLYRVDYTIHQVPIYKFCNDQRYWERFVSQWWHHDNLRFTQLELSADQQARLDEANEAQSGPEWTFELQLYVEWGAVREGTLCPVLQGKEGTAQNTAAMLHQISNDQKVQLAGVRYAKEVEGVTVGQSEVHTDRQTQSLIHGAYNSLQNGFVNFVDWKGKNGWIDLTLEQLHPIAERVMVHVQCCFSAERRTHEDIEAFTDPELLKDFDFTQAFYGHYNTLTYNHYNP